MEANLIALAVFLATLGGLFGLYALAKSYRDAAARLYRDRDAASLRRLPGMGAAVGGHNRPGDN